MAKTLPLFDYAALDRKTSAFLRQKSAEVKALMRQSVENVIKTGLILVEVRDLLPHGQWITWCEFEFGWHYSTAKRMISVAENFNLDSLSDMNVGASALYVLSAPTTPEEAREEARYLASQGQKITLAVAKDLRQQHLKGGALSEGTMITSKNEIEPDLDAPPVNQTVQAVSTRSVSITNKPLPQKAGPRERLKRPLEQQVPALKADPKLITSKAKVVEPGQTWRLGGFHILYCGEPTDAKFLKRVPTDSSLLLEFPIAHSPLPTSFINHFQSHLSFRTALDDFDLGALREIIAATIEGTTDGGDKVVLHRLPDPAIFLLIDQLECVGYCAEPDPVKCNMAIAAWTMITKRAASRV